MSLGFIAVRFDLFRSTQGFTPDIRFATQSIIFGRDGLGRIKLIRCHMDRVGEVFVRAGCAAPVSVYGKATLCRACQVAVREGGDRA